MPNVLQPAIAQITPNRNGTLAPLEDEVRRGLIAITVSSFTSIGSTALLFGYICWRLSVIQRKGAAHFNQYVVVLLNLIFADMIQGVGFGLSLHWLREDSITADATACRVQGWFINAGDVGACFFTLAMGLLLFSDIVLERRIKRYSVFALLVAGIWVLDLFLASVGLIMQGDDFYRRAGLWCWINEKYMDERLALHYIWVLMTEFGTVVLYSVMFLTLWRRVRELMWEGDEVRLRRRAQSAAWSVIAYPIVYVVCTLPAVIARLSIMAGREVGNVELSAVGFMLVSNGWMDVLLYSTTRRSLVTGQAAHDREARTLDTFAMCRGEGHSIRVADPDKVAFEEIQEVSASTSNSWEKDTISRGYIAEKRTRDFTVELDAIWRPHRMHDNVTVQTPNWETLEQVSEDQARQWQSSPSIGNAK